MTTPQIETRVLYRAFMVYALASLGFWLVNGLSAAEEWRRAGEVGGWVRALTLEGTSNVVILALFVPVALLERWSPATPGRWREAIPVHFAGSLAFSLIHVLSMWGLRVAFWPLLFGREYGLDTLPAEFFYEYRKDLLSYALILAVLAAVRSREEAVQRASAALADARCDQVITLRSGGRELRLPAADIVSAHAAGNYVDVQTVTGRHLARSTLAGLETLLEGAGIDVVRLHRSHLTVRSAIRAIVPASDGNAEVELSNGDILPVSRRYRANL